VNTTRQSEHIEECSKALEILQRGTKSRQQKLQIKRLPSAQISMDEAVVDAIVMDNRPFTLFEQPSMRTFLERVNPLYKPPSAETIRTDIIPRYYKNLRSQILGELRRTRYLNITFDESTNINHERCFVLTITTPTKSWFYSLRNMKNMELNALNIADEIY
jgi:hypothetical protein